MPAVRSEPDQDPVIPRFAVWKGKRVRVLYYLANGNFMVSHRGDNRVLHRNQMTFVKGKGEANG